MMKTGKIVIKRIQSYFIKIYDSDKDYNMKQIHCKRYYHLPIKKNFFITSDQYIKEDNHES